MIRIVLLGVVLVACGPSDRERDCAEVKQILRPHAPKDGRPRRYWDYGEPTTLAGSGGAIIVDMTPIDRLRALKLRDPAVRDAVRGWIDATVLTAYSPYRSDVSPLQAMRPLAELCDLDH